jgi:hypothetical protein
MILRSPEGFLSKFDAPPPVTFISPPVDSAEFHDLTPADLAPPLESEPLPHERLEAMQRDYEALLAERERAFGEQLEAERARWTLEQGERLGVDIATALDAHIAQLSARVADILAPFVEGEILRRLLDDLVAAARVTLSQNGGGRLRLSGPADLLEIIAAKLAPAQVSIDVVDGPAVEVCIVSDATRIETRMSEWAAQLRERS